MPGVGKVTQKVLAAQGIRTGADLLQHRGLLEVGGWLGSCQWALLLAVRCLAGLGTCMPTP